MHKTFMAGEPTAKVFWVGAFVWASSYLIPLYFLPQTMFAGMWLATMAWGIVLCGSVEAVLIAQVQPSRKKLWPFLFSLLIFSALIFFTFSTPINTIHLLLAAAVFLFGLYCRDPRWLKFLLVALVAAAFISTFIALIQLLYPNSDFHLIAPVANVTRATANLRQPNLFAQLLLLASVGWMFLQSGAVRHAGWRLGVALVIGCGLAFSQSRTGFLGAVLLLLWVAFDKGLPRNARQIGVAVALGCGVALVTMLLIAHAHGAVTHLEVQQQAGADMSASRFGIWKNTLSLIAQNPWRGVGWGNFGQAWALTPFPGRPPAAFDNAHNLPLHLMVELGIPLALLLMGGLAWVLWRARHGLRYVTGREEAFEARCILMMLTMLAMHSLVEYPLWYMFFLLPAAFLLGQFLQKGRQAKLLLASGTSSEAGDVGTGQPVWMAAALQACGVMIVLGSLYAAWDYSRVLQVFNPFAAGIFKPLEERMEEARKSILFGYWADYALVTNTENFKGLDAPMKRAFNSRMNPHMLMVYAQYLAEKGETDKASYVADRLREFNNPVAKEFFAECDDAKKSVVAFQCKHPTGHYSFKDFP